MKLEPFKTPGGKTYLVVDDEPYADEAELTIRADVLATMLMYCAEKGAAYGAKAAGNTMHIASLPTRVMRQLVKRDRQGRIVETTIVETDDEGE